MTLDWHNKSEYLAQLTLMPKIDSNAHLGVRFPQVAFIEMLDSVKIHWLNICCSEMWGPDLNRQIITAERMHCAYPDYLSWVTSLNLEDWGSPRREAGTLAQIGNGRSNGAVGVKIHRHTGLVRPDHHPGRRGIDDPGLDPVFDYLCRQGLTLVADIEEPPDQKVLTGSVQARCNRAGWTSDPEDRGCAIDNGTGQGSFLEAMQSVMERHSALRVVWCHLGCREMGLEGLSHCLDRHPNLAVDLAARIEYLRTLDRGNVLDFFVRYQDRILYGTDSVLRAESPEDSREEISLARESYIRDMIYFATDWELEAGKDGKTVRGLYLPPEILKKVYFDNALKWYPGIMQPVGKVVRTAKNWPRV
ncbi:amidohydrolase [bacterium]|nr:amidohydrolase [bacterium]